MLTQIYYFPRFVLFTRVDFFNFDFFLLGWFELMELFISNRKYFLITRLLNVPANYSSANTTFSLDKYCKQNYENGIIVNIFIYKSKNELLLQKTELFDNYNKTIPELDIKPKKIFRYRDS